jgi:hypothetical protein
MTDSRAARKATGTPLHPPVAKPAWVPPDEGGPCDDGALRTYFVVRLRSAAAVTAHWEIVNDWLVQAEEAGRPWDPRTHRTVRRFEILRAVVAWAKVAGDEYVRSALGPDDDIARCALSLVLGTEVQPALTTGAAWGSLTIDEARRMVELARDFTISITVGGKVEVGWGEQET